jgi:hypothetical protein
MNARFDSQILLSLQHCVIMEPEIDGANDDYYEPQVEDMEVEPVATPKKRNTVCNILYGDLFDILVWFAARPFEVAWQRH